MTDETTDLDENWVQHPGGIWALDRAGYRAVIRPVRSPEPGFGNWEWVVHAAADYPLAAHGGYEDELDDAQRAAEASMAPDQDEKAEDST